MLENNVVDVKNMSDGGVEEMSQTAFELDDILLNKQFICEAVTKVKEMKKDTDLELSDYVASVATLQDMIDIIDDMECQQIKEKIEEILPLLRAERETAKICAKELSVTLQKLIAVVEALKERK
ncbi:uncharacterized protein LOC124776656 [Schistocerca piceifrons]|uniref:uncharacterized protein LOC124776656 n=1 Tax=Schistocerca piceifrons TaxID=274613 RepID=UPI001F5E7131|nr:uncharacterized protein LOC124776656 [Schistocerca piceifrons]